MSEYTKTVWQAGVTPVSAGNMNNLETQHEKILDILTTRGDMIYRDASTWARLPKGAEGHVLRQGANDPAWAAETPPPFMIIPNSADNPAVERWYLPGWYFYSVDTQALNQNRAYYAPIYISRRTRFDRLGLFVGNNIAGSSTSRLGLNEVNAMNLPGDLIVDAGEVDCTTSGVKAAVIDVTLDPGFYYTAIAHNYTINYPLFRAASLQYTIVPPVCVAGTQPGYPSYGLAGVSKSNTDPADAFGDDPVIDSFNLGITFCTIVSLREKFA
jgi:hypothetical protein